MHAFVSRVCHRSARPLPQHRFWISLQTALIFEHMNPTSGPLTSDHFLGSSVTASPSVKFSFHWEITDFAALPHKTGEPLRSSSFAAPGDDVAWQLVLYPRGFNDAECISLFLSYSGPRDVDSAFSVILSSGPTPGLLPAELHGRHHFSPEKSNLGWAKVMRRQDVLDALQFGSDRLLRFCCRIEMFGAPATHKVPARDPPADGTESVAALVEALHVNRTDTDGVLHVQGQCVPVHRLVLTTQSPVFRAMFRADMAEKATGQIEIADYSADAVREMKRFMYTGKVENLRDIGAEMLELAFAYELPLLRALCESALPGLLCESNMCRIFVTAHAFSLHELEDSALRYMCRHRDALANALVPDQ